MIISLYSSSSCGQLHNYSDNKYYYHVLNSGSPIEINTNQTTPIFYHYIPFGILKFYCIPLGLIPIFCFHNTFFMVNKNTSFRHIYCVILLSISELSLLLLCVFRCCGHYETWYLCCCRKANIDRPVARGGFWGLPVTPL